MEGASHRFEILPDQAYDHIHAGLVHMIALAARPQLIYFGTLAQRSAASRRALSALFSSCDCPRFLDINLRSPWYDMHTIRRSLKRADILKLSREELDRIAPLLHLSGSMGQKAEALARQYGLEQILVTCGEEGAWHFGKGGASLHSESEKAMLADTVGAGDGFSAVFILGMLCNWPIELSLARANAFAAAVCGIRGATPEDPAFYEPFLTEWLCTSS